MKRKIACLLTLFILGINFPALGNDKEIKVTEDLLKSEGFAVAKPSGIGFEKRFADRESCVKFFKKFGFNYESEPYFQGERGSIVERKVFKWQGFYFHVAEMRFEKIDGVGKPESKIEYVVSVDRAREVQVGKPKQPPQKDAESKKEADARSKDPAPIRR